MFVNGAFFHDEAYRNLFSSLYVLNIGECCAGVSLRDGGRGGRRGAGGGGACMIECTYMVMCICVNCRFERVGITSGKNINAKGRTCNVGDEVHYEE